MAGQITNEYDFPRRLWPGYKLWWDMVDFDQDYYRGLRVASEELKEMNEPYDTKVVSKDGDTWNVEYKIKDSGKREHFESGMQRDTQEGKTLWHLVADGPMLERWAVHLTGGAKKYEESNWMKAEGEAEAKRFRASAFRHFMQWYNGDTDEDHASAVYFNINGFEYVQDGLYKPDHGTERKM